MNTRATAMVRSHSLMLFLKYKHHSAEEFLREMSLQSIPCTEEKAVCSSACLPCYKHRYRTENLVTNKTSKNERTPTFLISLSRWFAKILFWVIQQSHSCRGILVIFFFTIM